MKEDIQAGKLDKKSFIAGAILMLLIITPIVFFIIPLNKTWFILAGIFIFISIVLQIFWNIWVNKPQTPKPDINKKP